MKRAIISDQHQLTPEDGEYWVNGTNICSTTLVCESCGQEALATYHLRAQTAFDLDVANGNMGCGCGGKLKRHAVPDEKKGLIEVIHSF